MRKKTDEEIEKEFREQYVTRGLPVFRIFDFLRRDSYKLAIIYGAYGIGKTWIVDRAIEKDHEIEGKLKWIFDLKCDSKKIRLTDLRKSKQKTNHLPASSRTRISSKDFMSDVKKIIKDNIKKTFWQKLTNFSFFNKTSRKQKQSNVKVLALRINGDLRIPISSLRDFFVELVGYRNDLIIKPIIERRKYTNEIKPISDEIRINIDIGFSPDEAKTKICKEIAKRLGNDQELIDKMAEIIRGLSGQHPGFIYLVCELIKTAIDDYLKLYNDGKLDARVKTIVMDGHRVRCREEVNKLIKSSLSEAALQAMHNEEPQHAELESIGLLINA